jgi:hypothetical protein
MDGQRKTFQNKAAHRKLSERRLLVSSVVGLCRLRLRLSVVFGVIAARHGSPTSLSVSQEQTLAILIIVVDGFAFIPTVSTHLSIVQS